MCHTKRSHTVSTLNRLIWIFFGSSLLIFGYLKRGGEDRERETILISYGAKRV